MASPVGVTVEGAGYGGGVSAPSTSTLTVGDQVPGRRLGYAVTTTLVTALMAVALVDGVTGAAILGVDSRTVRTSGPGFELAVTYGEVTRPALATPFDIEIEQPGGFEDVVRIAVDHEYLRMWDENGLSPAPSEESVLGEWVVWEYDPPAGTVLRITFDARIEPAAQEGRSGAVAVLDADDSELARLEFTTRVLP